VRTNETRTKWELERDSCGVEKVMSSHTACGISYQTFEGRETASFANGVATSGSSRPRSYGGSDSWLENLHRQHVSARNQVWTVLT